MLNSCINHNLLFFNSSISSNIRKIIGFKYRVYKYVYLRSCRRSDGQLDGRTGPRDINLATDDGQTKLLGGGLHPPETADS